MMPYIFDCTHLPGFQNTILWAIQDRFGIKMATQVIAFEIGFFHDRVLPVFCGAPLSDITPVNMMLAG